MHPFVVIIPFTGSKLEKLFGDYGKASNIISRPEEPDKVD